MTELLQVAPMRLWLLGPMAVGKSAIGTLIAAELGWPYLDNDTVLAAETGQALPDWAPGEALHTAEREVARALLERPPPFVASIAASAADHPALLADLAAAGTVITLTAPIPVLLARAAGTGRPLGPNPAATLTASWAERDRHARAIAMLVVDTSDRTPADASAVIIDHLRHSAC